MSKDGSKKMKAQRRRKKTKSEAWEGFTILDVIVTKIEGWLIGLPYFIHERFKVGGHIFFDNEEAIVQKCYLCRKQTFRKLRPDELKKRKRK